jgi:hypothetical protein
VTAPALALIPVLTDDRTATGAITRTLDDELLDRAARDDYDRWLGPAMAAGGCVRPIRLRGTVRDIDPSTGEILHALNTYDTRDKVIYLPCGDRRASVCPACAETYRADTYQLIGAGLAGGNLRRADESPGQSRVSEVARHLSPSKAIRLRRAWNRRPLAGSWQLRGGRRGLVLQQHWVIFGGVLHHALLL